MKERGEDAHACVCLHTSLESAVRHRRYTSGIAASILPEVRSEGRRSEGRQCTQEGKKC